jgi:5-methylcytosine-specific restriction endonuclease McrA
VGYKIKSSTVSFSKEAVYERDGYICQYQHYDNNGKKQKYYCTPENVTLDHVIPRSKGGTNSFTNTVTCCKWHNVQIKRGRTPKEAGLELLREPFIPKRNKGDMAVITFRFNPNSEAHRAFQEIFGRV